MKRFALVVDDDRILRNFIWKKSQKYRDLFHVLLAADGMEALEKLEKYPISLVVSDLLMPNMDGFELIAHLSENFPDIPVMVLTAHKASTEKKLALQKTAAEYIEKPFVVEDLVELMRAYFDKESEGGQLKTISLEMFVQLVEMASRTCTILVINKEDRREGSLLFRSGELYEARIGTLRGREAALEILGWEQSVLFIRNDCSVKEKRIEDNVQAILMDALRIRDEKKAAKPFYVETER
ncbi:MAG: response regulator [Desulfobacteraceae bacterium]|jgi:CheY-like chemotaxis protein|nr:response regulator [Desulfobacteraceae bacterium]